MALFHAAISRADVSRALGPHGPAPSGPLPEGAVAVMTTGDLAALHRLLRRAFQLARTLPAELLRSFENLDAAFDLGFLTVADLGDVLVSPHLPGAARALLGLDRPLRVARLTDSHRPYLAWHRSRVFRAGPRAR